MDIFHCFGGRSSIRISIDIRIRIRPLALARGGTSRRSGSVDASAASFRGRPASDIQETLRAVQEVARSATRMKRELTSLGRNAPLPYTASRNGRGGSAMRRALKAAREAKAAVKANKYKL